MEDKAGIVVTGTSVVCNLGADLRQTLDHLRRGAPPVFTRFEEAVEADLGCALTGMVPTIPTDDELGIERKQSRFMGRAARLALWAARQALAEADIDPAELAVVVGSGTGDVESHQRLSRRILESGSARRAPATLIPRIMASTVSANLSNALCTRGPSVSASAACAGGAWNLAIASQLLQSGHAGAALAGGVEVRDLHFHAGFDRIQAYNRDDNDTPERASRPYAADRGGFIFAEGAGVLVLEREADAIARGARILGRIAGFGMSSDGVGEMVAPSADGAARSMRSALRHAGWDPSQVGYVNTHATSTPQGDLVEVEGMRRVFDRMPPYGSTKGYTGHTVSAAGAMEAVFTLAMLREGWLAPCVNARPLDPALADHPPICEPTDLSVRRALSNSFGFGGTNCTLALEVP